VIPGGLVSGTALRRDRSRPAASTETALYNAVYNMADAFPRCKQWSGRFGRSHGKILAEPLEVLLSLNVRSCRERVGEWGRGAGRSYVKNFLRGVEARPPLINETARMARARGRVGARTHCPRSGHHQASGQDAIAVIVLVVRNQSRRAGVRISVLFFLVTF
jgi:hypothetical protein